MQTTTAPPATRRPYLWTALILLLTAAGLAIRLPKLESRPMHGDEANQAVKAGDLWAEGEYEYDATEHHGPSLYWLTLPSLWLSGAERFAETTEWSYRIVPVLFGAALIAIVLLLADGLGWPAAALAALLTAISPAMVFYSRYYVQEMLLVVFTAAAIGCGWRFVRSGSLWWAVGAGAAFGMMHATKETWVLAATAMVGALAGTILWSRWFDPRQPEAPVRASDEGASLPSPVSGEGPGVRGAGGPFAGCAACNPPSPGSLCSPPSPATGEGRTRAGASGRRIFAGFLVAQAAAILVAVAFYSSFGHSWDGPLDSVRAYGTYFRRGSEGGIHANPWWFYLEILLAFRPGKGFFWSEGLIAALALVGAIAALLPRGLPAQQRPLVRFLTFYALGLTAIYSLISYKTPWCMLSFFHAWILLAGVGGWVFLRLPSPVAREGGERSEPGEGTWKPVQTAVAQAAPLTPSPSPASGRGEQYSLTPGPSPASGRGEQYSLTPGSAPADHFVVPGEGKKRRSWPSLALRAGLAIFLAAGVAHLGWECRWLNGRLQADGRNPYVYAHSSTDVLNFAKQMERLAAVSPRGHAMVIHVLEPDNYWPLPWYLRRFERDHVGYWQDADAWQRDTAAYPPPDVLLVSPALQEAVDARLKGSYNRQMLFGLRPGVFVCGYVREDLWEAFLSAAE